MADIWYDVDTALAEVPVNIFPLTDDTDFKTIEDAVAYNAAGMALNWHFCTTAGAYTVTAVTPTTAGNYDWTDQGTAGIYTIEIPASGGASINNDTEGFGWFTGVATGVLPWRGPICGFRAAATNNSLVDGTTIDVNVTAMAANTVTASAIAANAIDFATFATDTYPLFGILAAGTAASGTASTIVLATDIGNGTDQLPNQMGVFIYGGTGVGQARVIDSYVSATKTATVSPNWLVNPGASSTYVVFAMPQSSTSTVPDVNVTKWLGTACATPTTAGVPEVDATFIGGQAVTASGGITFPAATLASTTNITAGTITTTTNLTNLPSITAGWLTAAGIAAGALDGKGNWNVGKTGYSLTATTGLGNQTANITGNLSGSVGSVTADVNADIKKVNGVTVNGDGAGTPWGP